MRSITWRRRRAGKDCPKPPGEAAGAPRRHCADPATCSNTDSAGRQFPHAAAAGRPPNWEGAEYRFARQWSKRRMKYIRQARPRPADRLRVAIYFPPSQKPSRQKQSSPAGGVQPIRIHQPVPSRVEFSRMSMPSGIFMVGFPPFRSDTEMIPCGVGTVPSAYSRSPRSGWKAILRNPGSSGSTPRIRREHQAAGPAAQP